MTTIPQRELRDNDSDVLRASAERGRFTTALARGYRRGASASVTAYSQVSPSTRSFSPGYSSSFACSAATMRPTSALVLR